MRLWNSCLLTGPPPNLQALLSEGVHEEAPCEFCAPLTPTQWDSWEVQTSKSKRYAKRAKRVSAKVGKKVEGV
jgi:hypothetical protein